MAACWPDTNPGDESCPSDYRMLSDMGHYEQNTIAHTRTLNVSLEVGDNLIPLLTRTRVFSESDIDKNIINSAKACIKVVDATDLFVTINPSSADIDFRANYSDSYDTLDTTIRYMDLRNDLVVYRSYEEVSAPQTLESTDAVVWNQYNTTMNLHKLLPGDVSVTGTEKDYINETEISSKAIVSFVAANEQAFAFPPRYGTPQYNEPEDYYIWATEKENSGGMDLFYPHWLQVRGKNTTIDFTERDFHYRLSIQTSTIPSAAMNITFVTPLTDCPDLGGWAVDTYGDKLYSQQTLTGAYNYLTAGTLSDIITDIGDVYYPLGAIG